MLKKFLHKIEKSYEILRFALALNGYGSAFQHLLVRLQYDENRTMIKKGNNMKLLIDLSAYQTIDLKKKLAFTLAEVLITLGIIGIVRRLQFRH